MVAEIGRVPVRDTVFELLAVRAGGGSRLDDFNIEFDNVSVPLVTETAAVIDWVLLAVSALVKEYVWRTSELEGVADPLEVDRDADGDAWRVAEGVNFREVEMLKITVVDWVGDDDAFADSESIIVSETETEKE